MVRSSLLKYLHHRLTSSEFHGHTDKKQGDRVLNSRQSRDGLSVACYAQPSLGLGTPRDLLKAAVEKHLPKKSKQNTSVGAPGEWQGKCGTTTGQNLPPGKGVYGGI